MVEKEVLLRFAYHALHLPYAVVIQLDVTFSQLSWVGEVAVFNTVLECLLLGLQRRFT
jgi:hypothetical protein